MKKKYILIMSLILVVLIILGVSYALLQKNIVSDNEKVIYRVGDLEVKLDETGSKDISLENAIPVEDSDGMKNEPYSFSLVNNAVTDLKYTIYLEDDADAKNKCGSDCELIPYNFIKYNLSNDSNSLKTDSLSSSSTELYTGTIESKSTDKFNLRVWLSIDADNSAMGKYYFGKLKVVLSQKDDYCIRNEFTKLSDCMLVMNDHESNVEVAKQNIVAKDTPNFSKTATTDKGLFMTEDDYGPSYYYRGAVKNNYVSFAGFIWRIIRQNGDGSIRLIYAGKKTNDNEINVTIGISSFNLETDSPAYVGYMYGQNTTTKEESDKNELDSSIKKVVDGWYEYNLLGTTYEEYLADSGFCNDRSITLGDGVTKGTVFVGKNIFNGNPSLKCTNIINDLFTTKTSTIGNQALKYPIALITGAESVFAGVVSSILSNSYLISGIWYWTMTPIDFIDSDGVVKGYTLGRYSTAYLKTYISSAYYVRPVINLKSTVEIRSGDGTSIAPFVIK